MKNHLAPVLCKVEYLKPGENFEIPGLTETMRNMTMISSSDCSSLIEGQRRDGKDDEWKHFRYTISNSVLVRVVKDFSVESNNETKQKSMKENTEKRGRGRPKTQKVPLASMKGIDGEFTTSELIKLNGIRPHEARIAIQSAIKSGGAVQSSERCGKKGKPQKVYKLL